MTAKQIKSISSEIYDIIKAVNDGEQDYTIYDSYEEYNKSMLEFIKSKDNRWFKNLFAVINNEIKKGADEKTLKKELNEIPDINKYIVNHIIDKIFGNDEFNALNNDNKEKEDHEDEDDESSEDDEDDENEEGVNDVKIEDVVQNFQWRANQELALNNMEEQDYTSGIHNQIMGAGKTFIILNAIDRHYSKNQNNDLYIITCYRQEILKELFFNDNGTIDVNKVNFFEENKIINLNDYKIINRVHKKKKTIKLSNTQPSLLIVNTDYLKALHKNKSIDYDKVNFIILDECHSVSSVKFYKILRKIKYDHEISIIGFSATPLRERAEKKLMDIFSAEFNKNGEHKLNIISNYDFINAIKDDVILPPYYIICEVNKTLNGRIGVDNKTIMRQVLQSALETCPYKKIIGWCRTIEHMKIYYKYIKKEFPWLNIYCSCCKNDDLKKLGYNVDHNEYLNKDKNCILLCVNKFREGSDIMFLDTAIYLDVVKKRSLLVSLQTSGRVLRKDKYNEKKCGLIIDSFVNINGIQVEVMTAQKIIKYYKQIFSLCDVDTHVNQTEIYNQMVEVCENVQYDEKKEEIIIKLDKNEKHNIKFKLELKTKSYDFGKLRVEMGALIDRMYNIQKKDKFDVIIKKIKDGEYMDIKTKDFWKAYDEIKNKEELNLPVSSNALCHEYKEFFNNTNWYEILGINTNNFYVTIKECREALNKLCKDEITVKKYYECAKQDKKIPFNPKEYYEKQKFTSIEKCFLSLNDSTKKPMF
jgi:superfamily II DNA or RNA helicase